jgi:hypothetical protein
MIFSQESPSQVLRHYKKNAIMRKTFWKGERHALSAAGKDRRTRVVCGFASQYISFLERDETLVRTPLTLEQIREYGLAKSISTSCACLILFSSRA